MKPETDRHYGLSREQRELMDWNDKDQESNSLQKALKSHVFQLGVIACWMFIFELTIGSKEKGWMIVNSVALTVSALFFGLLVAFHGKKAIVKVIDFICKPVV